MSKKYATNNNEWVAVTFEDFKAMSDEEKWAYIWEMMRRLADK